MQSSEIRERFLKFFEKRGHKIVPSSSLIPGDPSVLFTTAGMQQFKPYYTNPQDADKDFGGKNVATVQKCIRTGDIDEVGDATHLTFFEMLGNFSFGGYWKKEAIEYAHEFITKELGLTIDYVSIFKDDSTDIPADEESRQIWQSIDKNIIIKEHKKEDNFWGPTGDEGPCGPTTEIYINGVEIWNIVFNEFYKTKEGKYEPLKVKGIDTGMGLERLLVQIQKKNDVFESDLFSAIMDLIKKKSINCDVRSARIISDHFRTSVFIIIDGITASNTGRGYILRRLLRRVFTKAWTTELPDGFWIELVEIIFKIYDKTFPEIKEKFDSIVSVVKEEEKLFKKPLDGVEIYRLDLEASKLGVVKKMGVVPILKDKDTASGLYIYKLFETFGNPIDLMIDVAKKTGLNVDEDEVNKALEEHRKLSQISSVGMFKGGLANHNEKTIKLHTAHHLLLAGLQAVVSPEIKQRGSNITEERLRIDFLCDHKLTDEEKKKVEDWVNDKIKQSLVVTRRELPRHLAEKIGAEMEFGAKYPDMVSVYLIGPGENYEAVSKEFCGGPHVTNTKELGKFKIQKEEAVAKGIRRIKALLV